MRRQYLLQQRWKTEQGRHVLIAVFSFLQLSDMPSARRVCVAWWRASCAREVWIAIGAPLGASLGFGIRNVEGALKQAVLAERERRVNAAREAEAQMKRRQEEMMQRRAAGEIVEGGRPSWLPVGAAAPSWVPQLAASESAAPALPPRRQKSVPAPPMPQLAPQETLRCLKEELDSIASAMLMRFNSSSASTNGNRVLGHHEQQSMLSALQPWQRGEVLDAQVAFLHSQAKAVLHTVNGPEAGETHRLALLEKRQTETRQLAATAMPDIEVAASALRSARKSLKIAQMLKARRGLVAAFERRVVGHCVAFSDDPSTSRLTGLATFFDLEMACIAPARIGSRLYINWSAAKRTFPIDEIYFEAADVLLRHNNVQAIENVVAAEERSRLMSSAPADENDDEEDEEAIEAALENHSSASSKFVTTQLKFVAMLRKVCVETIKREAISTDVSSPLAAHPIRVETHSLIIDTMIGFVYSSILSGRHFFGESHHECDTALQPRNWRDVLESFDRAKARVVDFMAEEIVPHR